jgi:hypothetical protein
VTAPSITIVLACAIRARASIQTARPQRPEARCRLCANSLLRCPRARQIVARAIANISASIVPSTVVNCGARFCSKVGQAAAL